MKLTIIFLLFYSCAFAQTTASTKGADKATMEKHKADSIAALTIDYPLETLTPAQEKRLKEFDEAPGKLQEDFKKSIDEIQKNKIAYIIGIIEAQKIPVNMEKVKDFEHKPNKLILKVIK